MTTTTSFMAGMIMWGMVILFIGAIMFVIYHKLKKYKPMIKYKYLKKPMKPAIVMFAMDCIDKNLEGANLQKHYLMSGYPLKKYKEFLYVHTEVKKTYSPDVQPEKEMKGGLKKSTKDF